MPCPPMAMRAQSHSELGLRSTSTCWPWMLHHAPTIHVWITKVAQMRSVAALPGMQNLVICTMDHYSQFIGKWPNSYLSSFFINSKGWHNLRKSEITTTSHQILWGQEWFRKMIHFGATLKRKHNASIVRFLLPPFKNYGLRNTCRHAFKNSSTGSFFCVIRSLVFNRKATLFRTR